MSLGTKLIFILDRTNDPSDPIVVFNFVVRIAIPKWAQYLFADPNLLSAINNLPKDELDQLRSGSFVEFFRTATVDTTGLTLGQAATAIEAACTDDRTVLINQLKARRQWSLFGDVWDGSTWDRSP